MHWASLTSTQEHPVQSHSCVTQAFSCPNPSLISKVLSALLQQPEAFKQTEDHLYSTVYRMHRSTSMIFQFQVLCSSTYGKYFLTQKEEK